MILANEALLYTFLFIGIGLAVLCFIFCLITAVLFVVYFRVIRNRQFMSSESETIDDDLRPKYHVSIDPNLNTSDDNIQMNFTSQSPVKNFDGDDSSPK